MHYRALNTLESGRVARYHAAPTVAPQTVGQHAWGVAVLVLSLTGGEASTTLLTAALLHDAAELYTGDIPFTAKQASPFLKDTLASLEKHAHGALVMGMPKLTHREEALLKLADTLEGLLWCKKTEHPGGPVLGRWQAALENGCSKFATVLTVTEISRARELASSPDFQSS